MVFHKYNVLGLSGSNVDSSVSQRPRIIVDISMAGKSCVKLENATLPLEDYGERTGRT